MQTILDQAKAALHKRQQREREEFSADLAAAEAGDVDGMAAVAADYDEGLGVEKNLQRKRLWLERATEAGDLVSPHNLALCFDETEEFEEARRWYLRAVQQHGDAQSMNNLGWMTLKGNGCERDLVAAADWFRKAIDGEDVQAMLNLAILLDYEDPVANAFRASELFQAAAEGGIGAAMFEWGRRLFSGRGVATNRRAAEHWMRTLAGKGSVRAEGWLRVRGFSRIEVWEWVPTRSLGPLLFGAPIVEYLEPLGLILDEDMEGLEDDDDREYTMKYYPLSLSTVRDRLLWCSTSPESKPSIRYQDSDLIGLSLESMLTLLSADDCVVRDEDLFAYECSVSSEQLGIDFEVLDSRVVGVSLKVPGCDPLWL